MEYFMYYCHSYLCTGLIYCRHKHQSFGETFLQIFFKISMQLENYFFNSDLDEHFGPADK